MCCSVVQNRSCLWMRVGKTQRHGIFVSASALLWWGWGSLTTYQQLGWSSAVVEVEVVLQPSTASSAPLVVVVHGHHHVHRRLSLVFHSRRYDPLHQRRSFLLWYFMVVTMIFSTNNGVFCCVRDTGFFLGEKGERTERKGKKIHVIKKC